MFNEIIKIVGYGAVGFSIYSGVLAYIKQKRIIRGLKMEIKDIESKIETYKREQIAIELKRKQEREEYKQGYKMLDTETPEVYGNVICLPHR